MTHRSCHGTKGCPACSFLVDNIGHLSHLHARDTELAVVTRAPLAKSELLWQRLGWNVPWYSSAGSDFNYDFHVTLDETVAPVQYNYKGLHTREDTSLVRGGCPHRPLGVGRAGDLEGRS
jgi:predicted dithiol-disulfide oxidoreductase (DUF899 family)